MLASINAMRRAGDRTMCSERNIFRGLGRAARCVGALLVVAACAFVLSASAGDVGAKPQAAGAPVVAPATQPSAAPFSASGGVPSPLEMQLRRDEQNDRLAYAPPELTEPGVDEHLGDALPLNLNFTDEHGRTVRLGDLFGHGRPVVLQLSYFECPMLCGVVSQGLVDSLNGLPLEMGRDFDVVNVSFDPREDSTLALKKKQSYVKSLDRPNGAEALHLLVGDPLPIRELTQAVGFKYKWLSAAGQFSHPAVLVVCSPQGKITRYLYGVKFDPAVLKTAIAESSEGKVGSSLDRVLLICLLYAKNSPVAMGIMRTGGVLTVLILAGVIIRLLRKEFNQRKLAEMGST